MLKYGLGVAGSEPDALLEFLAVPSANCGLAGQHRSQVIVRDGEIGSVLDRLAVVLDCFFGLAFSLLLDPALELLNRLLRNV